MNWFVWQTAHLLPEPHHVELRLPPHKPLLLLLVLRPEPPQTPLLLLLRPQYLQPQRGAAPRLVLFSPLHILKALGKMYSKFTQFF